MLGAGTKLAARLDLAPFADVSSDASEVLVVYVGDVIHAELADLATRGEAPTAATWASTSWAAATGVGSTAFAATLTAFSLRAAESGSLRSLTAVFV